MPRIRKILDEKITKPAPVAKKKAKVKNIAAVKIEKVVNSIQEKITKPAPVAKKKAKAKSIAVKKIEKAVNPIQEKIEKPIELKSAKPAKRKYVRKEKVKENEKDFISFIKHEVENRNFSLEEIEKIREILENIKEKEIKKLEENIKKNQQRLEALKKVKG